MLKKLRNLFKDEKGQDLIEYSLLAAFISIVAIAAIVLVGDRIIEIFGEILDALT